MIELKLQKIIQARRGEVRVDLTQMMTINRRVGLPLYPTGTRPKGEGRELNPFLGDGVLGFKLMCGLMSK